MPRKRPLHLRISEAQDKMDRLNLEKNINDLKERVQVSRRRRR